VWALPGRGPVEHAGGGKALAFLPATLPLGIGIADPMTTVRNAAYPVAFHERPKSLVRIAARIGPSFLGPGECGGHLGP
jgi:hypothetical protein